MLSDVHPAGLQQVARVDDDDVDVGQQSAGDWLVQWSNLILWTEELGGLLAVQRLLYSAVQHEG